MSTGLFLCGGRGPADALAFGGDQRSNCYRGPSPRSRHTRKNGALFAVGLALFEDRDRLLAHAVNVEAFRREDARGRRRLHAQNADQEVLGADVLVEHRLRLVRGIREDLLRLLGERQFRGRRDAIDEQSIAFDFPPDLLRLDIEAEKIS
jgi:hypothetical protein